MVIEIPVEKEDHSRFIKWCNHYNMKTRKKRGSNYILVEFTNPLDLYWLGCNMAMQEPESPLLTRRFQ